MFTHVYESVYTYTIYQIPIYTTMNEYIVYLSISIPDLAFQLFCLVFVTKTTTHTMATRVTSRTSPVIALNKLITNVCIVTETPSLLFVY